MKIGPKYKIARRLGSSVFEKTQSQKYILREQQKFAKSKRKFRGALSNYGSQLIEKQRVRFTYGLNEKQFANYLKAVIKGGAENQAQKLYELLEKRLDNVVSRAGFATTRRASRQMVSHGHILVNGKKMTIPSYQVVDKDIISIREGSKGKSLFTDLNERIKETNIPQWLSVDMTNKEIKLKGAPVYIAHENNFNLPAVIQFYKR